MAIVVQRGFTIERGTFAEFERLSREVSPMESMTWFIA